MKTHKDFRPFIQKQDPIIVPAHPHPNQERGRNYSPYWNPMMFPPNSMEAHFFASQYKANYLTKQHRDYAHHAPMRDLQQGAAYFFEPYDSGVMILPLGPGEVDTIPGEKNPNWDFSSWTADDPDGYVVENETTGSYVTEDPLGAKVVCDGLSPRLWFYYLLQPPVGVGYLLNWEVEVIDSGPFWGGPGTKFGRSGFVGNTGFGIIRHDWAIDYAPSIVIVKSCTVNEAPYVPYITAVNQMGSPFRLNTEDRISFYPSEDYYPEFPHGTIWPQIDRPNGGTWWNVKFWQYDYSPSDEEICAVKFSELDESKLLAWYRADECDGEKIYDCSGNDRHGYFTGGTLEDIHSGTQKIYSWHNELGYAKAGNTYLPLLEESFALPQDAYGTVLEIPGNCNTGVEHREALYLGTYYDSGSDAAGIYKYTGGGSLTTLYEYFPGSSEGFNQGFKYKDKLYFTQYPVDAKLIEVDENDVLQDIYTFTNERIIQVACEHNGLMYIICQRITDGNTRQRFNLYTFNGVSVASLGEKFNIGMTGGITSIISFQNMLYVSGFGEMVGFYIFNDATQQFELSENIPFSGFESMRFQGIYNDVLVTNVRSSGGTNEEALFTFTGETWEQKTSFFESNAFMKQGTFVNGKLYIPVVKYDDYGDIYEFDGELFERFLRTYEFIYALARYQGDIFPLCASRNLLCKPIHSIYKYQPPYQIEFKQSNCLNLEGTGYVECPLKEDLSSSTFLFWIKPESSPAIPAVYNFPLTTEDYSHQLILNDTPTNGIMYSKYPPNSWVGADINLYDGEWHHIGITETPTAIEFYVDGNHVISAGNVAYTGKNPCMLYIGALVNSSGSTPMTGQMCDFRVFKRPLLSEEVIKIKNGEEIGDEFLWFPMSDENTSVLLAEVTKKYPARLNGFTYSEMTGKQDVFQYNLKHGFSSICPSLYRYPYSKSAFTTHGIAVRDYNLGGSRISVGWMRVYNNSLCFATLSGDNGITKISENEMKFFKFSYDNNNTFASIIFDGKLFCGCFEYAPIYCLNENDEFTQQYLHTVEQYSVVCSFAVYNGELYANINNGNYGAHEVLEIVKFDGIDSWSSAGLVSPPATQTSGYSFLFNLGDTLYFMAVETSDRFVVYKYTGSSWEFVDSKILIIEDGDINQFTSLYIAGNKAFPGRYISWDLFWFDGETEKFKEKDVGSRDTLGAHETETGICLTRTKNSYSLAAWNGSDFDYTPFEESFQFFRNVIVAISSTEYFVVDEYNNVHKMTAGTQTLEYQGSLPMSPTDPSIRYAVLFKGDVLFISNTGELYVWDIISRSCQYVSSITGGTKVNTMPNTVLVDNDMLYVINRTKQIYSWDGAIASLCRTSIISYYAFGLLKAVDGMLILGYPGVEDGAGTIISGTEAMFVSSACILNDDLYIQDYFNPGPIYVYRYNGGLLQWELLTTIDIGDIFSFSKTNTRLIPIPESNKVLFSSRSVFSNNLRVYIDGTTNTVESFELYRGHSDCHALVNNSFGTSVLYISAAYCMVEFDKALDEILNTYEFPIEDAPYSNAVKWKDNIIIGTTHSQGSSCVDFPLLAIMPTAIGNQGKPSWYNNSETDIQIIDEPSIYQLNRQEGWCNNFQDNGYFQFENLELTGDFSISFFCIYSNNFGTTLHLGGDLGNGFGFSFNRSTSLQFSVELGNAQRIIYDLLKLNIEENDWLHIVCLYVNGDTLDDVQIYINGILLTDIVSSTGTIIDIIENNTNTIACWIDNTATPIEFYTGKISDFRVYNRILIEEEIDRIRFHNILGDEYCMFPLEDDSRMIFIDVAENRFGERIDTTLIEAFENQYAFEYKNTYGYNEATYFDGVGVSIEIPTAYDLSAFTIIGQCYLISSNFGPVFTFPDSGLIGRNEIAVDSSGIVFVIANGDRYDSTENVLKQWVWLIQTYDGINPPKLYINGSEKTVSFNSGGNTPLDSSSHVGRLSSISSSILTGIVRKIYLYNIELNQTEITDFINGASVLTGLIGQWEGNGNDSEHWEDTVGVNNGIVYGSPEIFTIQSKLGTETDLGNISLEHDGSGYKPRIFYDESDAERKIKISTLPQTIDRQWYLRHRGDCTQDILLLNSKSTDEEHRLLQQFLEEEL